MYKITGADGREYGPVTLAQLRQWFAEGRVNLQTRVLAEGAADWKTMVELPEFALSPLTQPIRPLITPGIGQLPRTNSFAVTGLILSIVSLIFSFCCCGCLPLNLISLIFSAVGLSQINRQPDVYDGKGAAIAGLVISGLGVILGAGVTVFWVMLNWMTSQYK